jgi:N-acetylglucosaminyldiphosphoundecaprenol N-acetyl-beta-D-mannosaminyltransferase
MEKQSVAGLNIDFTTKKELLEILQQRIKQGQKTWLTTPYSEFLYAGLKDPEIMALLNKADIAVPDGIGIFWAKKFLSIPFSETPPFSKGRGRGGFRGVKYWSKIFQALWQIIYSLLAILFNPKWIYSSSGVIPATSSGQALRSINDEESLHFPKDSSDALRMTPERQKFLLEKIPGSELILDLAKLASENNLSIYLLGGFGNTAEIVAKQLKIQNSKLKISGFSAKNPSNPTIHEDIKKASPDLLFVAYGALKQEAWIAQNIHNLPVKLVIGVGGSFDYLAEKRLNPPKFMRKIGLEWLFRLFTQPHRIKRIWQATFGLCNLLWHYKVFDSMELRPNVVIVILNNENKILIAQRKQKIPKVDLIGKVDKNKYQNYWQLPQGGVEHGETSIQAGLREANEEVGLKNLELIQISKKTNTYFWNYARKKFRFNKKYQFKGQCQNFVYLRYSGNNQIVNVNTPEKEFINFKWVDENEFSKIVHPERSAIVKIVLEDLKEMQEKGII